MSGIFSGFQTLIDTLLQPIRIITSIIYYVNQILAYIIEAMASLIEIITTTPTWIKTYLLLGITIVVIYQLLGRETG